jgi:hypothetical protein
MATLFTGNPGSINSEVCNEVISPAAQDHIKALQKLVITHIFYARQFQGRKQNLSREFHEFSRIGFKNPCELAKFAAKCSGIEV